MSVDNLIAEMRRIDRIAGGYAIVELDLKAQGLAAGHPGLAFVCEQSNRVARDFDRVKRVIAAEQARCSHAYEKIGEARPPFWRCVRCQQTRTVAP